MMRGYAGWLVSLADLSLILFIVTGSALTTDVVSPVSVEGRSAKGIPAAVHVDASDAPPLVEMLAAHPLSAGEQLTIEGHYAPGERASVAMRAERLAQQAIAVGVEPRVILQPSHRTAVVALSAHDRAPELAYALQSADE